MTTAPGVACLSMASCAMASIFFVNLVRFRLELEAAPYCILVCVVLTLPTVIEIPPKIDIAICCCPISEKGASNSIKSDCGCSDRLFLFLSFSKKWQRITFLLFNTACFNCVRQSASKSSSFPATITVL